MEDRRVGADGNQRRVPTGTARSRLSVPAPHRRQHPLRGWSIGQPTEVACYHRSLEHFISAAAVPPRVAGGGRASSTASRAGKERESGDASPSSGRNNGNGGPSTGPGGKGAQGPARDGNTDRNDAESVVLHRFGTVTVAHPKCLLRRMKGSAPLNASLDVGYDAFVEKRRDIGNIVEEGAASTPVASVGVEHRQPHGEASSSRSGEGALAETEIAAKEALEQTEGGAHAAAPNSEGVARRAGTTDAERRVLGDTLAPVLSSVPSGMKRRAHIITFRNNLNKLMNAPYNTRDAFEIGVARYGGTIVLDVRHFEHEENLRQKHMSYWGYRFEHIITTNSRGCGTQTSEVFDNASGGSEVHEQKTTGGENEGVQTQSSGSRGTGGDTTGTSSDQAGVDGRVENSECVDSNVEFCSVVQTSLGPYRILMGAEIDAAEDHDPEHVVKRQRRSEGRCQCVEAGLSHYVELKTSQDYDASESAMNTFRRHKSRRWWIQSYLAGVRCLIVGLRSHDGILARVDRIATAQLPSIGRGFWDPGVCLHFTHSVFEWLFRETSHGGRYIMTFCPQKRTLELMDSTEAMSWDPHNPLE